MHYQLDSDVLEAKVLETRMKEVPINIIESCLQIRFERHKTFLHFGPAHKMK